MSPVIFRRVEKFAAQVARDVRLVVPRQVLVHLVPILEGGSALRAQMFFRFVVKTSFVFHQSVVTVERTPAKFAVDVFFADDIGMRILSVETQARQGGVGGTAVRADERLLVRMYSHVTLQRRLSAEFFFAFLALELVPVFGLDVLLVLGVALTNFLTEFALDGLARVEGQVLSQVTDVLVSPLAELTLEGFVLGVDFLVLDQVRFFGECPATDITLAILCYALKSLAAAVGVQKPHQGENDSTVRAAVLTFYLFLFLFRPTCKNKK